MHMIILYELANFTKNLLYYGAHLESFMKTRWSGLVVMVTARACSAERRTGTV
jgi:hypothetical protein